MGEEEAEEKKKKKETKNLRSYRIYLTLTHHFRETDSMPKEKLLHTRSIQVKQLIVCFFA